MGLFKGREEKALEYFANHYKLQIRINQEQAQTLPLMDQRRELSRYHPIAMRQAAQRTLKDKGLSPDPDLLSRDYWAMTCLAYGLGDAAMSPNPFQ